ncbi:MAG: TIGR02206 family membrane protein [Phycisphaerales bacterium]|nr:TIGR02206 family membrane protein [Phycisphaerales bacterium]
MPTAHHAAWLVWAVITAIVCVMGVRMRGTPKGARFDRLIGLTLALGYVVVNIYWFSPPNLAWDDSLPIQLCDLAALCAPLAILTRRRPLRVLLYFWGFGLSTQGFFTPTVAPDPTLGKFWMHWINHGAVVGGAVYDLVVCRYRPTWRDWRFAIIASLLYVALIFGLDIATGWNYAYVGNATPEQKTLVDVLGPWPLRVLWIVLIAGGAMTALMLPWTIARRLKLRGTNQ